VSDEQKPVVQEQDEAPPAEDFSAELAEQAELAEVVGKQPQHQFRRRTR
jgi:hypothetical protein